MELNKLQLQAIKEKAGYKSTDYCNVNTEQVKQFLLDQGVQLGNRKKKETLLQVIWDSTELTQTFGEQFFDDFFCNVYDLINSYKLTWEQAQALIQGGLSKKGYPVLTLNALKFSRDEIRELYDSHFGGNIVKVRLEVDSEQQGLSVTTKLAELFEVGELNYHSRRDDSRLHLYTTLFPKDSVSEAYNLSENARLKQELAETQLKLQEANKQLTDFKVMVNTRELTVEDMDKYQRLQDRYNNLVETHSQEYMELRVLRMEKQNLEEKLKKATNKKPQKFTEQEKAEIIRRRAEGIKMQQLAIDYNCSIGLIHKVLNSANEE